MQEQGFLQSMKNKRHQVFMALTPTTSKPPALQGDVLTAYEEKSLAPAA